MKLSHTTLPMLPDRVLAVHPVDDLVALVDEQGNEWIWYEGQARYVSSEGSSALAEGPASQWVVDYTYVAFYLGTGHAIARLNKKMEQSPRHPASIKN